jgi:hypothetical protein
MVSLGASWCGLKAVKGVFDVAGIRVEGRRGNDAASVVGDSYEERENGRLDYYYERARLARRDPGGGGDDEKCCPGMTRSSEY